MKKYRDAIIVISLQEVIDNIYRLLLCARVGQLTKGSTIGCTALGSPVVKHKAGLPYA